MSTTLNPLGQLSSARASALFLRTRPDPAGLFFQTGFRQFSTISAGMGLHGLYKDDGSRLEILAIAATEPNVGLFRAFVAKAKTIYDEIVILHIWNPWLGKALSRYGFVETIYTELDSREEIEGMVWTKNQNLCLKQ